MDFCPRCGRYLKDYEYQCPECGNIVRQRPSAAAMPDDVDRYFDSIRMEKVDVKAVLFERYFFIAFIIGFAATVAITYYWRFSLLFFFIPMFLPTGRISISAGLMGGVTTGSLVGLLIKYWLTGALIG